MISIESILNTWQSWQEDSPQTLHSRALQENMVDCLVSMVKFLQLGGCVGFILLMWALRVEWPVLSWKIRLWSDLHRVFILSFFLGLAIS